MKLARGRKTPRLGLNLGLKALNVVWDADGHGQAKQHKLYQTAPDEHRGTAQAAVQAQPHAWLYYEGSASGMAVLRGQRLWDFHVHFFIYSK